MSAAGTWDVTVKTPIGSIAAVYVFTTTSDTLTGTASAGADVTPLTDLTATESAAGTHLTWHQRVTRPLRLNLEFDVTITGDTLTGHSRAGRLPRSTVTGRRRPPGS